MSARTHQQTLTHLRSGRTGSPRTVERTKAKDRAVKFKNTKTFLRVVNKNY